MGIRNLLEPAPPSGVGKAEPPMGQKLLWFYGLMAIGVGVVAGRAYLMRALLFL